jgi:hypothetical protein
MYLKPAKKRKEVPAEEAALPPPGDQQLSIKWPTPLGLEASAITTLTPLLKSVTKTSTAALLKLQRHIPVLNKRRTDCATALADNTFAKLPFGVHIPAPTIAARFAELAEPFITAIKLAREAFYVATWNAEAVSLTQQLAATTDSITLLRNTIIESINAIFTSDTAINDIKGDFNATTYAAAIESYTIAVVKDESLRTAIKSLTESMRKVEVNAKAAAAKQAAEAVDAPMAAAAPVLGTKAVEEIFIKLFAKHAPPTPAPTPTKRHDTRSKSIASTSSNTSAKSKKSTASTKSVAFQLGPANHNRGRSPNRGRGRGRGLRGRGRGSSTRKL